MASKGPKDRSNSNGITRAKRQQRVSLAAYMMNAYPVEYHLKFYTIVLAGKIPIVTLDDEHNVVGLEAHEPNGPVGSPTFGIQAPTMDQRFLAQARIAERTFGQPAQHTHIQAELKAELNQITTNVDIGYYQQLPDKDQMRLRNLVLGLPDPFKAAEAEYAEAEEVEDAEFEMSDEPEEPETT